MELNREQIIKALECCVVNSNCNGCPFWEGYVTHRNCLQTACKNAISLIKELTEENRQFRYEHEKIIEERDTFIEYAYNMQKYVENIKHKEEKGYEPSAARYAAEMEMWRVVALDKKKLTEENERLRADAVEVVR